MSVSFGCLPTIFNDKLLQDMLSKTVRQRAALYLATNIQIVINNENLNT